MSDTYQLYAPFYDALTGDRTKTIERIQGSIYRYFDHTCQSVLEVACGTGEVLAGLFPGYDKTGLDISEDMLRIARAKLPVARLVHADMANFDLGRQFDAIFCTHNSLNHLTSFERWQMMFACVVRHMHEGGIFMCDAILPERLMEFASQGDLPMTLPGGRAAGHVQPLEQGLFDWNVTIAEPEHASRQITVRVLAASPARIAGMLQAYFTLLEQTPVDGRMYYVCRKK